MPRSAFMKKKIVTIAANSRCEFNGHNALQAVGELMSFAQAANHPVVCLAASPDGRHVAASYSNASVAVWDVQAQVCVHT